MVFMASEVKPQRTTRSITLDRARVSREKWEFAYCMGLARKFLRARRYSTLSINQITKCMKMLLKLKI